MRQVMSKDKQSRLSLRFSENDKITVSGSGAFVLAIWHVLDVFLPERLKSQLDVEAVEASIERKRKLEAIEKAS